MLRTRHEHSVCGLSTRYEREESHGTHPSSGPSDGSRPVGRTGASPSPGQGDSGRGVSNDQEPLPRRRPHPGNRRHHAAGILPGGRTGARDHHFNELSGASDALAREIAEKRPHLVGLQEVFQFTLNGNTGAPPFRDLLEDLLSALAAEGADYYVVGQSAIWTSPFRAWTWTVARHGRDVVPCPWSRARSRCSSGCRSRRRAATTRCLHLCRRSRDRLTVSAGSWSSMRRSTVKHSASSTLTWRSPSFRGRSGGPGVGADRPPDAIAQPGLPVVIVGDINSAPTDGDVITPGGVIGSPVQAVHDGRLRGCMAAPSRQVSRPHVLSVERSTERRIRALQARGRDPRPRGSHRCPRDCRRQRTG